MKTRFLLVVLLTAPLSVFAADVNGTWEAEFETQRGLQKYTFTLKQAGSKVTGKVNVDTDGEKRETETSRKRGMRVPAAEVATCVRSAGRLRGLTMALRGH
jgi:hypothetical protein